MGYNSLLRRLPGVVEGLSGSPETYFHAFEARWGEPEKYFEAFLVSNLSYSHIAYLVGNKQMPNNIVILE